MPLTQPLLDDVLSVVPEDRWAAASDMISSLRDCSHMTQALTELYRQGVIERRLEPGAIVYEYRRKPKDDRPCHCDVCRMLRRRSAIGKTGSLRMTVDFEAEAERDTAMFLVEQTARNDG